MAFTIDNAYENDVVIKNMKEWLPRQGKLLLSIELFYVRCTAHVLNLIVQDGLDDIDEWLLSKYDYIQAMAGKMLEKFKKYWDEVNLPLAIIVVLDPRYKLALVRYNLHRVYGYVGEDELAKVRECLYNFYSHYANYDTSSTPNEENSPLESSITSSASGVMQESKKKYLKSFQKWCTSDEITTSVF
uniref:hAT-like transposase RNase-H fold domain-containing protein n=1 Tax=Nelumbo nucifera TaxID=4432 RepID=A0A822XQE1_NELNU|nr:TPA_asm: hypothetical protein HUJ06_022782 [Nelumbo nucifera]